MDHYKLLSTLEGHKSEIWYAVWCPIREEIASCGSDKTIRIWRKIEGQWRLYSTLTGQHKKTIRCVEYSPDGQFIASCSFDSTVVLWKYDGRGYKYSSTLEGHANEVKHISWKPDGELLASCSRDRNIMIWGREEEESNEMDCYNMLLGHTQDIKFISWHPHLNRIYSCSYDNTIKIWEEEGLEYICKYNLTVHRTTVWGLAFIEVNNGKDIFASVDGSGTIVLWVFENGEYKGILYSGYSNFAFYSVDYRDGYLLCGGEDNRLYTFKYNSEQKELEFIYSKEIHTSDLNCVRWNSYNQSNTKEFLTCSDDRTLKIWNYIE